tara:strand:+ start:835 stop:1371 length:537 start_codon:yes stop_codon:yes gene_type:complete
MDYKKVKEELDRLSKELKNPTDKQTKKKSTKLDSKSKISTNTKDKSYNKDEVKITWSPTSKRLIDDLSSNDKNLDLLTFMDYEKIDRWKKFIRMYIGTDKNPYPSDPWYPMRYLNTDILESLYFNISNGLPNGMVRDVRLVCESLDVDQKTIRELQDEVRERCTDIVRDSGQYNDWFI